MRVKKLDMLVMNFTEIFHYYIFVLINYADECGRVRCHFVLFSYIDTKLKLLTRSCLLIFLLIFFSFIYCAVAAVKVHYNCELYQRMIV